MHVCFVCNEYPPGTHGGVGSFTQTLARALVTRGHRVTVVGIYPSARQGEENDRGVRVIRLAHATLPGSGFLANGLKLRRTLQQLQQEHPIDILEGPENGLALVPAHFSATKIIRMNGGHRFFAKTLGNPTSLWRSWLEKRSFAHADQLCAVSNYVAETTRELLQLNGHRIEILPNPVDVEMFQPHPEIAEEPGLILFVGTVCEKKGVRQLVQAMPKIVAAAPHARLWLAGRDWHDPQTGASYIGMLRGLIPVELTERIVFKGPVEHAQLPELLAQAAVCVYPSHMEALPLAWLEGLAMGKAVVASHTGPGPEVIVDRESGLLCNPHEPGSIAEKIIELLNNDALRQQFGQQARRRAVEHFSIESLVGRNEEFYLRFQRAQH